MSQCFFVRCRHNIIIINLSRLHRDYTKTEVYLYIRLYSHNNECIEAATLPPFHAPARAHASTHGLIRSVKNATTQAFSKRICKYTFHIIRLKSAIFFITISMKIFFCLFCFLIIFLGFSFIDSGVGGGRGEANCFISVVVFVITDSNEKY